MSWLSRLKIVSLDLSTGKIFAPESTHSDLSPISRPNNNDNIMPMPNSPLFPTRRRKRQTMVINSCIRWRRHQLSKAINLGGLVRGGGDTSDWPTGSTTTDRHPKLPRSNAMTMKRNISIRIILQMPRWIQRRPSYRTINDCDRPTLYPRVPIAIPPGLVRSR